MYTLYLTLKNCDYKHDDVQLWLEYLHFSDFYLYFSSNSLCHQKLFPSFWKLFPPTLAGIKKNIYPWYYAWGWGCGNMVSNCWSSVLVMIKKIRGNIVVRMKKLGKSEIMKTIPGSLSIVLFSHVFKIICWIMSLMFLRINTKFFLKVTVLKILPWPRTTEHCNFVLEEVPVVAISDGANGKLRFMY